MKINKNDCIMIGDSYTSDIQGGTKMEIKSILVRSENKNYYRNYCKDLENIIKEIESI
jgi:putative hydrolase of the HAD superfamily